MPPGQVLLYLFVLFFLKLGTLHILDPTGSLTSCRNHSFRLRPRPRRKIPFRKLNCETGEVESQKYPPTPKTLVERGVQQVDTGKLLPLGRITGFTPGASLNGLLLEARFGRGETTMETPWKVVFAGLRAKSILT
uniref:Uncharacterized protein n=1 Tax=Sphaerodactylus townsendi TaxID=933632 RepID=A0ACB8E4U9_9SAUR